jgi:tRNA pseudouridine32 synthase/23S rRNA pseudouridine746 synthase
MEDGMVLDDRGSPLGPGSPYAPGRRISYFREVEQEPAVPFRESVLYRDERILVVCKPHFLPVMPSGRHVNETLLTRLQKALDIRELVPLHRIDRETAGLVLFSTDSRTRGAYQSLFMERRILKTYEAVTLWPRDRSLEPFSIQTRIVRGEPWFLSRNEAGIPNALTRVEPLAAGNGRALLRLCPVTGRKHQIRVHLQGAGCPIVNDRYYPVLLPEQVPDFQAPLQLLARELSFVDPVTREPLRFVSGRTLAHAAPFRLPGPGENDRARA